MNILYLSCHSILEYDELRIFEELGHDYFSIGAYINPTQPHDPKRPALNGKYHEHLASVTMVHHQANLHPEQIEWADIIIVMHIPEWIELNWEKMKHKRVVWRSIGQSVQGIEERLQKYVAEGMEIVRYSPRESAIPGYIGATEVIRFYKDPAEFGGWVGDEGRIMTIGQSMRQRGEYCNYDIFHDAFAGLPADLYGPGNDGCPESRGMIEYDELKHHLRHHRVYFYTGTHPASYTLGFIEAMMTGIPIIAIGHGLGNSKHFSGQKTYEIPDIIVNGYNGYVSDTASDIHRLARELIDNPGIAQRVGENGRRTAIDLFGMKKIKEQWRLYLEKTK